MIIFDLDCLANCEHRRHFVDPLDSRNIDNAEMLSYNALGELVKAIGWKPDWNSFYDACDKDTLILPVAFQFYSMREKFGIQHPIVIWSGRCESVREKTIDWLKRYFSLDINWTNHLKMRPIGDSKTDEDLYETWLNECCADMIQHIFEGKTYACNHNIDFVFSANPDVISMFKRRGVFVFDCNQDKE